jgi:hypothetical protein
MLASSRRFISLLSLACGCTPAETTSASQPVPQVVEPAKVEPAKVERAKVEPTIQPKVEAKREIVELSGPLEIEENGRLAKPSAYAPQTEEGMTDEPYSIGWSKSTGEFLVCVPMGGADCNGCDFHRLGAKPERVETGSEDCNLPPVPERKLKDRIAAGDFRVEDGTWAYGGAVVLVVEQKQGEPDSGGIARGVVQIGARLRTPDAKVAWLETIVECEDDSRYCAPDVHIDAIAPAPDGQTITVLMHSFAGEFSDTYPLRMLDADTVATAAYEAAGLERPALPK